MTILSWTVERSAEYMQGIHHDKRQYIDVMKGNLTGPTTRTDTVRAAIIKYDRLKSYRVRQHRSGLRGGGGASQEFGILDIINILREIHDTGHTPKDMLESVLESLPEKAAECGLHNRHY